MNERLNGSRDDWVNVNQDLYGWAYGKLIKTKWICESIDAYANNIKWLGGFVGRSAGKIVKLAFVHGFLDQILIALQQLPQVETKEMS